MRAVDFHKLLQTAEYDFIREQERLNDRILFLGLGGSYAYGTNYEGSDIDFRGVTLQMPSDLIGLTNFEQYEDSQTDTVIYGFNKFVRLLLECNPNICEMLGLDEDQYLIMSPLGKELIDNAGIFLSKRAIRSFGGYAEAQLRRMQNAIARDALPQSDREQHLLKSALRALEDFNTRFGKGGEEFQIKKVKEGNDLIQEDPDDSDFIRLYVDRAVNPELEKEIFFDAQFHHYPLRDYTDMWGMMRSIVKEYEKGGRRRLKKDENHLNKHAMHLIRLYMMAIDILEKGEIRTRRKEDLPLLLSIRRGDYLLQDGTYAPEFFELLEEYGRRMDEAAASTCLPDEPDMEAVEAFVMKINRYSVTGRLE